MSWTPFRRQSGSERTVSTVVSALHAASREALAAAEARLVEIVVEGSEVIDADAVSALGEDLFAVAGLLSREPTLRRALADASTEQARREQLLRRLLEGKVSELALSVLASVVAARWSSPRELVDGVVWLGRTALLVRAERDGRLDDVEDELFRFGRIVAAQPELDVLLSDPVANAEGKVALVAGLLEGKVEPVTLSLVEQLVTQLRGHDVLDGLDELTEMAAKRRERSVAYVRVAFALTEAQQERLATILGRIYSRPIALHVEVDTGLIGGLLIRIGDEVIDGSTAGQLAKLRRELTR
jgi:F-type H+-transporting ATPase subunit delta